MAEATIDHSELLALTSDIVAAHASNNAVPSSELSGLIESVFGTLSALSSEPAEPVVELKPAVPIKKSVTADYLICLDDGKKLKMLKRHLKTAYDMTPELAMVDCGFGHFIISVSIDAIKMLLIT